MITSDSANLSSLFFTENLDEQKYTKELSALTATLYKKYPENLLVQKYKQKFDKLNFMPVNSVAPDIELPNPDGEIVKLSCQVSL